jgi:hypothetical protein
VLDDNDEFAPSFATHCAIKIADEFNITLEAFREIVAETQGRMAPVLRAHREMRGYETAQALIKEFDAIMSERGLTRKHA